jgi:hypothetical protein
MKKTPVVAGASLSLYSIIAGEVELMGQANLRLWSGDLRFWGLTKVLGGNAQDRADCGGAECIDIWSNVGLEQKAKRSGEIVALRANRRFLRRAQDRLFDCASRDETATGSAQDDNFYITQSLKLKLYVDTPRISRGHR